MKGQKPLFAIAIVLLCSTSGFDWPAAAQTIVPTDAFRGQFIMVGFPPSDLHTSDELIEHFDPHTVAGFGTVEDSVGEFSWTAEHQSTVAATSLLASGSMRANITFDSIGSAYSFMTSRFELGFELTDAATVRIRGRIAMNADVEQLQSGAIHVQTSAGMSARNQGSIFARDLSLPGDLDFCAAARVPAGMCRIDVRAYISAGEAFYAPDGTMANASYDLVVSAIACPMDLDGDAVVDLSDLAVLLGNFGMADPCSDHGDLDFDRDVDLIDLATLLVDFGTMCE